MRGPSRKKTEINTRIDADIGFVSGAGNPKSGRSSQGSLRLKNRMKFLKKLQDILDKIKKIRYTKSMTS